MSTDADLVIAALQAAHDDLAPRVAGLSGDELRRASAASEWDVSQVVSHLGSGAVITRTVLEAAVRGEPNPGFEAFKPIWDRWDGMTPEQRRDEFGPANEALLAAYDGLDAATRAALHIDMGFLPQPLELGAAARFRLNEVTLHSWDVRVTFDDGATLRPDAVPLLIDMSLFMVGMLGKAEHLGGRAATLAVRLPDAGREFAVRCADGVTAVDLPAAPDAVLTAPAEAWLRLVSGRLAPGRTPADVEVTGALGLDDLRAVFPGY